MVTSSFAVLLHELTALSEEADRLSESPLQQLEKEAAEEAGAETEAQRLFGWAASSARHCRPLHS